ncbi:uncharacterized protein MYCFIDRAFT_174947 [Pseudocercospora fijiensis CIRAD86]|uniref:Uncharacterized protein n=1 Tax=Pseudocercospora fijiensis (strain CIRAD86) TaxID=383855 RepID=M2Z0Z8_PSEFD|nr:uncharacterized protein MYCFIDRAFT_174947 [Pseudocercospora fijiensis CIRAD86]EME83515.1 hypothetical protein MYCFIDRAFT_174947 [Pseudocercospora fijiensis CIRAD86]
MVRTLSRRKNGLRCGHATWSPYSTSAFRALAGPAVQRERGRELSPAIRAGRRFGAQLANIDATCLLAGGLKELS